MRPSSRARDHGARPRGTGCGAALRGASCDRSTHASRGGCATCDGHLLHVGEARTRARAAENGASTTLSVCARVRVASHGNNLKLPEQARCNANEGGERVPRCHVCVCNLWATLCMCRAGPVRAHVSAQVQRQCKTHCRVTFRCRGDGGSRRGHAWGIGPIGIIGGARARPATARVGGAGVRPVLNVARQACADPR